MSILALDFSQLKFCSDVIDEQNNLDTWLHYWCSNCREEHGLMAQLFVLPSYFKKVEKPERLRFLFEF